jgi:hypothetical protein
MSHSNGAVIKNGEILGFFEYNGTCDVAISSIWPTFEDLRNNWHKDIWNKCKCDNQPLEAILYTNYGGGFHWLTWICITCKAIVTNHMPFESEGTIQCTDGLPKGVTRDPFQ